MGKRFLIDNIQVVCEFDQNCTSIPRPCVFNQWEALNRDQMVHLAGKRLDWPTLDVEVAEGSIQLSVSQLRNFLIFLFNVFMIQQIGSGSSSTFESYGWILLCVPHTLNLTPWWPTRQSESSKCSHLTSGAIWKRQNICKGEWRRIKTTEPQPLFVWFYRWKRVFPSHDECVVKWAGSDSFICPQDDFNPCKDKVMEGGNTGLCKNKHPL